MPTTFGRRTTAIALLLLGAAACDDTTFNTLEVNVEGEGYDAVIQVVEGNCTSCHAADGSASFLVLTEDVFCDSVLNDRFVIPGDAEGSVLYQRISDAGSPMPPTGMMSEGNLTIVGDWIDAGAECSSAGGSDGADGAGGTADGEALFDSGCTSCHGADGDSGYAPSLSDEVPGKTLDAIITLVENGQAGMPAIYTDSAESEAVAQYVLDTFGS